MPQVPRKAQNNFSASEDTYNFWHFMLSTLCLLSHLNSAQKGLSVISNLSPVKTHNVGNSLLFSAVGFGHTGDSYTLAGCIGTCLSGVPGLSMAHPPTSPCDIFGTLQLPTVWLCSFPEVHSTSCYSVLLFPTPPFFALFAFLKKKHESSPWSVSPLWLA